MHANDALSQDSWLSVALAIGTVLAIGSAGCGGSSSSALNGMSCPSEPCEGTIDAGSGGTAGTGGAAGGNDAGSADVAVKPKDPPPDDCALGEGPARLAVGVGLIAVDQAHIYFTKSLAPDCTAKGCSSPIELHRIPRCGGSSELIAPATARVDDAPIVAPAGHVAYFTEGATLSTSGNDLIRLNGASRATISTTASCLTWKVADASFLYAHDRCQSALVRVAHSDPALVPFVTGATAAKRPFSPLALTPTRIYYADAQGVSWASLDGASRGRAYLTSLGIAVLSADENALFVTEGELFQGFNLVRVPLDGGPTQIISPLEANTAQTVVSYGTVYFGIPGAVSAAPADGTGAPRRIIEEPAPDFDVFGARIYWVRATGPNPEDPRELVSMRL